MHQIPSPYRTPPVRCTAPRPKKPATAASSSPTTASSRPRPVPIVEMGVAHEGPHVSIQAAAQLRAQLAQDVLRQWDLIERQVKLTGVAHGCGREERGPRQGPQPEPMAEAAAAASLLLEQQQQQRDERHRHRRDVLAAAHRHRQAVAQGAADRQERRRQIEAARLQAKNASRSSSPHMSLLVM